MDKNKKIIIEDPIDLLYAAINEHGDKGFGIIGSYDTMFYIINAAIHEDYDLVYAEFEDEDCNGYDKGFYVSFTDEGEIWVKKAYNGNTYICVDDNTIYIEDVYEKDYKDIYKNGEFFVFGFNEGSDNESDDDDGVCMCIDNDEKGFKLCIYDEDGSVTKFSYRGNQTLDPKEINKILEENGFN